MDDAFDFIVRNGGIDTEEDYPYTAKEGKCDLAKKAHTVVSIDGFEDVPWGPGWGEGGYIRMERNVTARAGKCGIAMFASYPVKTGPNPKPAPPAPEEKCDRYSSCPAGSTCCCTYGVRSVCLAWGCCPAEGATCCRDRATCCPSEYPVCNAGKRTCGKSKGSPYSVDALPRTPAKRQRTAVSELVDSIFSI
ncbi:unnamed protein product [Triticum turgidum subsp. durum]|uniref:Granulins domain-containing protein n=1 Tax=Triticum turgidum subsp. durum TaxID=4567 RepID=A0A9R1Q230_TRITD|nr:unnamed protein product [Triticum turgidum subsp. durum]